MPRKKHSASYWVLLVMASPIWLPLGAAAFAIVFCALIALALLSPQVFRITRAELAKLEEKKGALGVDKGERF